MSGCCQFVFTTLEIKKGYIAGLINENTSETLNYEEYNTSINDLLIDALFISFN